jgi:hypothetical protein
MVIPDKLLVSLLTMKKKYSKKELLQFCGIADPALNQKRLDTCSKESIFILAVKVLQKLKGSATVLVSKRKVGIF